MHGGAPTDATADGAYPTADKSAEMPTPARALTPATSGGLVVSVPAEGSASAVEIDRGGRGHVRTTSGGGKVGHVRNKSGGSEVGRARGHVRDISDGSEVGPQTHYTRSSSWQHQRHAHWQTRDEHLPGEYMLQEQVDDFLVSANAPVAEVVIPSCRRSVFESFISAARVSTMARVSQVFMSTPVRSSERIPSVSSDSGRDSASADSDADDGAGEDARVRPAATPPPSRAAAEPPTPRTAMPSPPKRAESRARRWLARSSVKM